jgi:hypothetical protein
MSTVAVTEKRNSMIYEYGRFLCRVCGELVFVPLPQKPNGEDRNGDLRELTCSKGHTDAYDFAELEELNSKPAESLKARRAVAGMG